jgi:chromosome segregation ATPase
VSADGLAVFIEDPLAVMRAIESLRQALAAKDGELADVRQQLDASIEEQRALQSLVAELREQAAALQGAAEAQCVGDVDALDARLAESRQRSAEGTEAGQLHGVVLAKEREIEMLRAQLEQTGASEGSAAEEVSKLRRALAVKDRHIEALRREVEELGSALAADGAGGDAAADARDLQQAAAEAESSWRALAKKDSEMDGLRANTLQLEGLLAAKDRELAGLRERLEANARGDARDAEAVAAAEAQVRQIEAALSEAESERRTLQRKVAELQGELVLVTVERDCLAAAKAPPALTVEVCLAFLTSFLSDTHLACSVL